MKNKREHVIDLSSIWENPSVLQPYQEEDISKNVIFTVSEYISHNMNISLRNRNVAVIGSSGAGKSHSFLKSNLLNAHGSMVVNDPCGDLLKKCKQTLVNKGYRIKILNLNNTKWSEHYNPFSYFKEIPSLAYDLSCNEHMEETANNTQNKNDILVFIHNIIINTDEIDLTHLIEYEYVEVMLMYACFLYVVFNNSLEEQNLTCVIKLLENAIKDDAEEHSQLDLLFSQWREKDSNHVGVQQYEYYKSKVGNMEAKIISLASWRLEVFNHIDFNQIISNDTLDLNDIGAKGVKGKIAIFIITTLYTDSDILFAKIFYTQLFQILNTNAKASGGIFPTNVNVYFDEFKSLGNIPHFKRILDIGQYINVGYTLIFQSVEQIKTIYRNDTEEILNLCHSILFFKSNSDNTLEWIIKRIEETIIYQDNNINCIDYLPSNTKTCILEKLNNMEREDVILFIIGFKPFLSKLYNASNHL